MWITRDEEELKKSGEQETRDVPVGNPDMGDNRIGLRVKNSQNGGKKGANGESNVKEWALQNFGSLQM